MKLDQKLESLSKQQKSIVRPIVYLAVALIATIQLGCSSTGSSPTQQVFSQPTNFGNPQGNFQGQGQFFQPLPNGQFNQGGSGTSFQTSPAQFNQGSGTSFQTTPQQFNQGSGTNFQTNPGSGSRGIFGVGYQQPLSYFQSGFIPFAPPKTTC